MITYGLKFSKIHSITSMRVQFDFNKTTQTKSYFRVGGGVNFKIGTELYNLKKYFRQRFEYKNKEYPYQGKSSRKIVKKMYKIKINSWKNA